MIKNLFITVVTICFISTGVVFAEIEKDKKEGETNSEIVEIQKTDNQDVDATSSEIEKEATEEINTDELIEKLEKKEDK